MKIKFGMILLRFAIRLFPQNFVSSIPVDDKWVDLRLVRNGKPTT